MNHAIIDYGSNSVRVSIYRMHYNNPLDFSLAWTKKTAAGLIGYLDPEGAMTQEGIDISCDVLNSYKKRLANNPDVVDTNVFATEVLRRAVNRDEVMAEIKERTGYSIDLLDGKEEAECGFLGAMCSLPLREGVQIDIGGSSTEVVHFRNREIVSACSLPIGSLSLFLDYVANIIPTMRESDDIRTRVLDELAKHPEFDGVSADTIAVVGGSGRAVSKLNEAWRQNLKKLKHPTISRIQVDDILRNAYYDPQFVTRDVLRIIPDRVHTVFTGALILDELMDVFSTKKAVIASYGVREGYLLSKVMNIGVDFEPDADE
jgi:exopolyphosphatase/guanosine-5'-triphosphate,3'-diphosphate pyrophosphatase